MCTLFVNKEEQLRQERKELSKWFLPREVLWLQQEHPHLAHMAADSDSGSQIIFEAQEIIDREFY